MSDVLGIWIDTKYHRIRVYKSTLKALGKPEYIIFGIGKKTKEIIVAPSDKNGQGAIRVGYSEFVHSKPLFFGIREYVAPLEEGKTYSLLGKVVEGVVVCSLPKTKNQKSKIEEKI